MKVAVQDLQPGMMVVYTKGKGILTVHSVKPLATELFPQQYEVTWEGIAYSDQFGEDEEFEVLGE